MVHNNLDFAMSLKTEVFYVSKSHTTYQYLFLLQSLKEILQAVWWTNLWEKFST